LYAPRKADGSLPDITFGHLAAGSDLIDKGVIILGLSYSGSAPDLGAFEYSGSATCTGSTTQSCTITNGVGSQSRTCNAGVWSSWGACTLVSCNSGYIPSGNTCVIPQPGGTCKDGIQNNGETGVDCGGPCIDCVLQADYYVATNGNDNNPGTITQPWKTWQKAFSTAQAGDLVYFRGGVYPYSGAVGSFGISAYNSGTADNWINFFNYPGEEPILDCSGLVPSGDFQRAISVFSKSYIHFKGLTVRNVHQLPYSGSGTGGDVTYSSGIDTYWSHNIIYENMNVHDVDGPCLTINGCDEIHVINSDAWNCNDHLASHPGQNGVGFQGANNVPDFGENMYNTHIYFEGCRTWNFSDNGFASPVVGYTEFKNCWAFDGGALTGEGCGFKLGLGTLSDLVNPLSKLVVNCISANNGNYGFSPNNNQGNVFNAHYYNNFAYHNGYKHYLLWWNQFFGCGFETCDYTGNTPAPNEMYSNNIAYANEYRDMFEEKPYIHNHNSWDINGIQVSNADFVSLDVSQLYSPRNANGSLPTNITFGHLKAGSDLIDKGVIIPGLSYSGSAPDLGAFEYSGTTTCIAETNTAFCTRLNKNCGSVTANDNCGNSRTVSSCGSCSGTCNNGVCTTCVAETNTAFCTRLNKNCGSVTANDNCGNSRTVSSCGSCSGVNTCGGGGTANVCGCTVSSYTPALNTFCGSRSVTTNCGTSVTMTGTLSCSSPNTCGGGGTANVCGCIAETNTAFCTRLNKNCGSVTANDNCGNSRTVSSCGSCSGTCNNGVCTTIPTTGAIIADHTIVDRFDDIPQCYIDKVKTMFFDYPGESHATAVYYGIYYLGQDYPKYACHNTGSGAPEAYTTAYLRVSWTTWGDLTHSTGWITDENGGYAYGEEDWWTNPTAVARTKAGLSYMNSIGVAPSAFGFGWCSDMDWLTIASSGVDPVYGCHWYGMSDGSPSGNRCWGLDDADNAVSGNSVNLDTYLRVTQEYVDYCKANNIPTKVFFTTGPLNSPASCTDCTDEQEYQGWLKMERIRDYVKAHNQILFDYADILSYNDDGTRATRTWNGHTFPTITTTNLGTGSVGHIGRAGALRLGKGVWWMMARIAGWDGVSTTCS
jgi:hypothetical protein